MWVPEACLQSDTKRYTYNFDECVHGVCGCSEMAQFLEGLETLHVGSLLKLNPSVLSQLYTYSSHQVTARDLSHLLVPVYSPCGSNAREEEEILNWNYYLQDLEGKSYKEFSKVHVFNSQLG